MYKLSFVVAGMLLFSTAAFAQEKKKEEPKKEEKPKKTLMEKADQVGKDLLAQPETVDTLAGKFVQDQLSINIPPVWKEKGAILFNDLKLAKADNPPFVGTLPLPEKKLVQGVVLTMNSTGKGEADKKAQVLTMLKTHLSDYYKVQGKAISPKEIAEQAAGLLSAPEKFTTTQGKEGNLYTMQDIQSQQAGFIVLLVIPNEKGGIHFVQFQYFKFIYDTELPEDPMELKTFLYPDHQQTYLDFTKKMMKTLRIQ